MERRKRAGDAKVAHSHLRLSETTEARQQSAGRHLHAHRGHREGLGAGQSDRRRGGGGQGLHERAASEAGSRRSSALAAAGDLGSGVERPRSSRTAPGAFRREDYIAPAARPRRRSPLLERRPEKALPAPKKPPGDERRRRPKARSKA